MANILQTKFSNAISLKVKLFMVQISLKFVPQDSFVNIYQHRFRLWFGAEPYNKPLPGCWIQCWPTSMLYGVTRSKWVYLPWLSDAIWYSRTWSSLNHGMACCMYGTKPVQGPVLLLQHDAVARILANGSAAFIESCAAIGWNSCDSVRAQVPELMLNYVNSTLFNKLLSGIKIQTNLIR